VVAMRARCFVFLALGVGAVGTGCAPNAATPKPPAAQPRPDTSSAVPSYRFVPATPYGLNAFQVDPTHMATVRWGDRVVVASDGAVERAPGVEMFGGPMPEHLGGGFVFWTSDAVYRARTFTGALEPIARVNTNAIGVEFGPSSVLLFTPDALPHA